MNAIVIVAIVVVAVVVLGLLLAIRIVQQYEMGVHFRLGKVIGVRTPGLRPIGLPCTGNDASFGRIRRCSGAGRGSANVCW
jgi:hypothetical protein